MYRTRLKIFWVNELEQLHEALAVSMRTNMIQGVETESISIALNRTILL